MTMACRSHFALRFWAPVICSVGVAVALGPMSEAFAAWTATAGGSAGAAATTMPTGTTPSGSPGAGSVSISWAAVTMPDGSAVTGYVIHRYDAQRGSYKP